VTGLSKRCAPARGTVANALRQRRARIGGMEGFLRVRPNGLLGAKLCAGVEWWCGEKPALDRSSTTSNAWW